MRVTRFERGGSRSAVGREAVHLCELLRFEVAKPRRPPLVENFRGPPVFGRMRSDSLVSMKIKFGMTNFEV